MTLIDTSVWVRFFRGAEEAHFAAGSIRENAALLHPLVLGELLLGGLSPENESLLQVLEPAPTHSPQAICEFIRKSSLADRGMGWVAAALLCSATEAAAVLVTFDEALRSCAGELGVRCLPPL